MSELLPLLVTAPAVAGVLPPLLARRVERGAWWIAVAALLVQTAVAVVAARAVLVRGPLIVVVGGFPAAVGVELGLDRLALPFLLLVPVVALAGFVADASGSLRSPTGSALGLFLVAGLTGLCLARDAFNLYVFLEICGLSAYALVATGDGDDAAPAALSYLFVGTVGASLYLLGVGYAYVITGTLNLTDLAVRFTALGFDDPLLVTSFGLVAVGLGVKVALFPVHGWKPDAYAAAPPAVTAVLSALVPTVAAYAFARLLLSAFTVDLLAAVPGAATALRLGAVASVVAGGALALTQRDVSRLLAYSGVSQFGVALAGFALGTAAGVVGGVVHLVGHAVMKGGAFAAAGVVAAETGAETVDEYAGGARDAPAASASLAVLAAGLVGLPPVVGFFGKWYVALAAVESGAWLVAAAVLLSTLLSLAYYARLVQRLYLESPRDAPPAGGEGSAAGPVVAAALAAVVAVALGLLAGRLAVFLRPVAEGLIG